MRKRKQQKRTKKKQKAFVDWKRVHWAPIEHVRVGSASGTVWRSAESPKETSVFNLHASFGYEYLFVHFAECYHRSDGDADRSSRVKRRMIWITISSWKKETDHMKRALMVTEFEGFLLEDGPAVRRKRLKKTSMKKRLPMIDRMDFVYWQAGALQALVS